MSMNYTNLGEEIIAEYDGLVGNDKYTPALVTEGQAKAIITHIQTNGEIDSSLNEGALTYSQSIGSNIETIVQFSGDNFSSGVFTSPKDGYYLPVVRITFLDDVSTSTLIYAYLQKNSTDKVEYLETQPKDKATLKLSKPVYLASGDTLKTIIYQIDGITTHTIDKDSPKTFMSIIQSGTRIT